MVAICAPLTRMRTFAEIGEWVANCAKRHWSGWAAEGFPARGTSPVQRANPATGKWGDVDLVDRELGSFLAHGSMGVPVAVDGNTVRRAVGKDAKYLHLLGALVHKQGVEIGQRQVDGKTDEITEFKPLLEPLGLASQVVTADAMDTQKEHARFLVEEKGADYLFIAKGSQPALEEAPQALDQGSFPLRRSR